MADQKKSVDLSDVHVATKSTNDEVSEEDTKCGYCGCKPRFLQYFNNPKALLVFLSCFGLVQGFVVNGIINVNVSTIERRFGLPSSQAGMITSAYDVFAAVFGVIISYASSGKHKARWVAISCILMSVGSLISAIPHFTTGLYQWGENQTEICSDPLAVEEQCAQNRVDTGLQNYLYVFLLGQMLHGMGGTTLLITGVALLDDSVCSTSSPLYVGIMLACASFGPAVGYVVGGQILNIYVDFDSVSQTELTPDDPRWAGAWWIGFLFAAALFVIISVPLFAYGAELPTAANVRKTRISQAHANHHKTKEQDGNKSLRNFAKSACLIIQNPTFTFATFASASEALGANGVATFLPKIIQNLFGTTTATAALLSGVVAVIGAAGGQFAGGLITKKWKLKVRGLLRFNFILLFIMLALDSIAWIRCDHDIAGVNVPYTQTTPLPGISADCNSGCVCSTEFYEPVCSDYNVQYFSPCHAGCQAKSKGGYQNCTCVSAYRDDGNVTDVISGKCSITCYLIYLMVPLLLINVFCVFMRSPTTLAVVMRCIPEEQRTFGLGIQLFLVRLLGFVPGPIIFGAVIDNACLVWQDKCEEKTACWIYNNVTLSRNFFLILVSFRVLAGILFVLAHKFYKPPPKNTKDETNISTVSNLKEDLNKGFYNLSYDTSHDKDSEANVNTKL